MFRFLVMGIALGMTLNLYAAERCTVSKLSTLKGRKANLPSDLESTIRVLEEKGYEINTAGQPGVRS